MSVARPLTLLAVAMGVTVMAGCAPTGPSLTIDDVREERASSALERLDTLMVSQGEYLTDRWPGVTLPAPEIERWLPSGRWEQAFASCVGGRTGVPVRADTSGGTFAYGSVVGEEAQRRLELALYECQGRFPPPTVARVEPGPVEVAWLTGYARDVLPACLRAEGVIAPPLSAGPFAVVTGGATPGWDPYREVRGDPPRLARVTAICPHPSTLLASVSSIG